MRSLYPVICSRNVQASKDFYVSLLDFIPTFDTGWYVQLQNTQNHLAQIGIVELGHESVPAAYNQAPRGIIITADYEDVTDVYNKVVAAKLPMVYPLTEEVWGQKHFMISDPDDVLVDISQIALVE